VYVRQKRIKGHLYYYLVEGRRSGGRTKQKVIRYLGKNPGGSVLTHGTGSNVGTSLPSPPSIFTVEESQPPPSTDEAPAIDEQPPQKVRWVRPSRKEPRVVVPEDIQVGKVLHRLTRLKRRRGQLHIDEWVVTSTRADGVFKAIPKKEFDKAVKKAECTAWLGIWLGAFHVITGHPPARIILMLFADTKHAESFTIDSAPYDALPI
jgi:hypothetical protein